MPSHDQRPPAYRSASGIELKASYGPEDVPAEHARVMGAAPGQPPYHRGGFPQGYRTKPWRIFQLSGFGKPEDENERIKFLLRNGETGFLMEHDRNTADHLYNVDHPDVVARKEDVGLTGAVMQSVRETELCLADLPIESTFGHAGGAVVQHAPFALAAYWTVAKRRGIPLAQLFGTGQSDFFLTYLGCVTKQQVPTAPGLRLNADIIEFCSEHLPKWVPVSIAGYNGGDTGLNAWQELGAVMANAIEYLDEVERRGRMDMTVAAQRVGGVNFRTTMEIFEDAAKLRAARKMWHKLLTERYGVTDERALRMRIHIVTSGAYMQYQQPFNNIVRGTLMALTAVLGGTQSLGVSGYDEAISIPSEHAHQMSVRIQQILEHETNIPAVTDPLGGSYYVESLTAELERRAWEFVDQLLAQGGFLATLDSGWLHARARENQESQAIAEARGERKIVGVNCFKEDIAPWEVDGFPPVTDAYPVALERLNAVRRERHEQAATAAMRELAATCRDPDRNIMPVMMQVVDAEVTIGEIGDIFRQAWGDWQTPKLV
ncbi:MAG: acyl-CoA mutase large subunit family protein [Gammaproteobacteria bacterium]|nr:acyl-CoA mutase large subunit family protein [Gammaproteobacteria bacterium]MDH4311750.1 acyl-CoA mutase large subunit family protein [Gammaproteobacteria bacterium]